MSEPPSPTSQAIWRAEPEPKPLSNSTSKVQFNVPQGDELNQEPTKSQLSSARSRRNTTIDKAESLFVAHKYIVRRPRPLQISYHGKQVEVGDSGKIDINKLESQDDDNDDDDDDDKIAATRTTSATTDSSETAESSNSGDGEPHERSTDNIEKQRERLDLFIDLVWVGITSNLSENFFSQSFAPHVHQGDAVGVFIILFVPSWQLWSKLQMFLNNYYLDDLAQRLIILWILICAVAWGNVAPFAVTDGTHAMSGSPLICLYLVASASINLTECLYCIWMPWTRRLILWASILTIPGTALWITGISSEGWRRLAFIWGGIVYERLFILFLNSPKSTWLLGDGIRKSFNRKHIRKRYESFFVIALGEGVFLLIRKSPLGGDLNFRYARGTFGLMIYFALHAIYLSGDSSRKSIHPLHRRWWMHALWQFLHLPTFASLVLLSSGMLYLVDYTPDGITNGIPGDSSSNVSIASRAEQLSVSETTLQTAIATCCTCLAFVLLGTLIMALLARPMDPPKTLIVNNRYLRLAPRMAAIPVLALMWLRYFSDPTEALGLMMLVVWVVFLWEWVTSMEKGGGFLEPKNHD